MLIPPQIGRINLDTKIMKLRKPGSAKVIEKFKVDDLDCY